MLDDIDIFGIQPERIDDAWSDIAPFIQMGLDRANGENSLDDVYQMIADRRVVPVVMTYEGNILSVVTLEIVQKPRKKIMTLMTAGGTELDSWLDEFMDVALELAIEQDCDALYVIGRPGWAKILKRYGFHQRYVTLTRELH